MKGSFGKELRRLREERKYTQKILADLLSVSISYISDIEKGNRNPLSLEKLSLFQNFLKLI